MVHTNKVDETLLEPPDLGNSTVQLPKAYHNDVHVRRQWRSRSSLFQNEPRYSQQHPDTSCEGNESTQPIIVVGLTGCDVHTV